MSSILLTTIVLPFIAAIVVGVMGNDRIARTATLAVTLVTAALAIFLGAKFGSVPHGDSGNRLALVGQ